MSEGSVQKACESRDHAALSCVLGVLDQHLLERLRAQVRELEASEQRAHEECEQLMQDARDMCPLLSAQPGDLFSHPRHDGIHDLPPEIFEYLGRATGEPTAGPLATPKGWLLFRWVDGPWGIGGGHGAVNGGVRDACGAFPIDKYVLYRPDGSYDHCAEMALPPDRTRCFEPFDWGENGSEDDGDEHNGDEEDGEG